MLDGLVRTFDALQAQIWRSNKGVTINACLSTAHLVSANLKYSSISSGVDGSPSLAVFLVPG